MRLGFEVSINRESAVLLGGVTKMTPEALPHLIFAAASVVLPTDRRLAILGRQGSGRSTLLQLLARTLPADGGVIATDTRFSMLLNGKGFMHPAMTPVESIEFLARMYGLAPKKLVELAVSLPGVDKGCWFEPLSGLDGRPRRALEMLVAALLPFDCYLVDDMERADPVVVLTLRKLLAAKGSGLIFTTFNMKMARLHADCAAVIANQDVRMFWSLSEAETYYER